MRVGGIITLRRNGQALQAKGAFDYCLGLPKRDAVMGQDRPHGFMDKPQVAYVEGSITDEPTLSLKELCEGEGLSITLELAIGKVFMLESAYWAGEGKANTEAGEIEVRWESSEEGIEF